MRFFHFSIRNTLFLIIGALNLIVALLVGLQLYQSWMDQRMASAISGNVATTSLFYNAQRDLSVERGNAVAILYASPAMSGGMTVELIRTRKKSNVYLDEALEKVLSENRPDLADDIRAVQTSYGKLQRRRRELDTASMLHTASMLNRKRDEISLPSKFYESGTRLIDDIDRLVEAYNRPLNRLNPGLARQLRFTHLIWNTTEFAGREYALIGKAIAENQKMSDSEKEHLQNLRGRIQYGWELARGALENNPWRGDVMPAMTQAESHYFLTFDKLKNVLYAQPEPSPKPVVRSKTRLGAKNAAVADVYPVTIATWLDIASQAVNSLHGLNDSVLLVNRHYVEKLRSDAQQATTINIALFAFILLLSLCGWMIIMRRVIRPIRFMTEVMNQPGLPVTQDALVPHRDDEIGRLVTAFKIFQTNARELELERDKAQAANIAKTDFLANMSHEIRTPMNVVIGLSNILSRSAPLTEKQKEFIRTLQLSAESLMAIINDLLDISKIETENVQLETISFSLEEVIGDVYGITTVKAKEKNLEFECDLVGIENKSFYGDPTKIRQILLNLCGNAIKFTEQGSVRLSVQSFGAASGGAAHDIYITVADTGIGIPADKVDVIFDKFSQADNSITRKYGGTGLGLSITKRLIEIMNGTIRVESEPGAGASFIVMLPLTLSDPATGGKNTTPDNAMPGPVAGGAPDISNDNTVLVVEDYHPNALVAGLYLEQFGFAHDVAENGTIALEKFSRHEYHAVLMDVQMHGLDGYQTTQEIRRFEEMHNLTRTKIIGMTAHALPGDRERCLEAGMDDYLPKPFDPEALRDKLAHFH